jgi:hypothetical protein
MSGLEENCILWVKPKETTVRVGRSAIAEA